MITSKMNAEMVVRTYSDMIYGIAMRYVRNKMDADDVYSETFYRYFRRERTFESEEHRRNWLIRVAVNCSKDFLIRNGNDAELTDDMYGDVNITGSNVSMEDVIDVRNALKQLREEYREIIELYYLNGLNTREIAMMLQKPHNTVMSQFRRAKDKLQELLQEL